jgi:serine O-acetyltransferase
VNPAASPGEPDLPADSPITAIGQDVPAAEKIGLWAVLREDWNRHYRSFAHPGLHALAVYRIGRWRLERNKVFRIVFTLLYKLVNNLIIRNLYGVEISDQAVIGRRVLIGHHQTILIPRYCVIGDDCTLRHNLTIGYVGGDSAPDAVAKIGKRVEIAPGVHLLGAISIGDDARIGPASVVMADVPAGSTVFAAPARIMRPPVG